MMEILGLGDPVFIMKDHSDARRRADLLARIAAATISHLAAAETLAGLDVDDRADLHWEADRDIAALPGRSPDGVRLLDLQLARLAWVHHSVARSREPRSHHLADTVATVLGAIIQLVEAWRRQLSEDAPPGRAAEQLDPMLADALVMVQVSADRLAGVMRAQPRPRTAA
ncbi:MAG TPA: hypothetical protein VGP91_19680 [Actinoplanes sp.]|nr:hypothetical protein [Actinoplanes sp.]